MISFLPTKADGAIGALDYKNEERRILATKSNDFYCNCCGLVKDLLPPLGSCSPVNGKKKNKFVGELQKLHELHMMHEGSLDHKEEHKNSTVATVGDTNRDAESIDEKLETPLTNFQSLPKDSTSDHSADKDICKKLAPTSLCQDQPMIEDEVSRHRESTLITERSTDPTDVRNEVIVETESSDSNNDGNLNLQPAAPGLLLSNSMIHAMIVVSAIVVIILHRKVNDLLNELAALDSSN